MFAGLHPLPGMYCTPCVLPLSNVGSQSLPCNSLPSLASQLWLIIADQAQMVSGVHKRSPSSTLRCHDCHLSSVRPLAVRWQHLASPASQQGRAHTLMSAAPDASQLGHICRPGHVAWRLFSGRRLLPLKQQHTQGSPAHAHH